MQNLCMHAAMILTVSLSVRNVSRHYMRDRARSSRSNADSFLSCVCVIIEISSGVGNRVCDN